MGLDAITLGLVRLALALLISLGKAGVPRAWLDAYLDRGFPPTKSERPIWPT